jgi:hypothetical protein
VASKKAFLLRIEPKLFDELSRWASDELRSVNGHMEFLLRRAVQVREKGSAAPPPEAGSNEADPDAPGLES